MKRWWASLATKVLGLQLAGLLTIAGVVGVTRYYALRSQLYGQVGTAADNLIQVIEETLAERPELLQPGALDPVVDRFTYKLPAVARVSVVAPGFTVLADSRLPVGQASDQTALLPLLRQVGEERFYYGAQGGRYLRLSRSLRGRYDSARRSDIVGAVSIDMWLAPADAALGREMVGEMGLVMGLLIPISALLVVLTRHWLIRPLEQLQEAGVRFGRGEAPAALTFSGSDELEEVGRAFNDMVEARTSVLKEREQQLSAAQARLHHVLASGNAIVYSVRVEGQTFIPDWVSDNLSRVMGYEVEDALRARWWLDHLHPEDRDQALAQLPVLFASGQFTVEYRFRHKDGQYRWVRDELHLVRDAHGTPREAVGVWLDVTERKVAEENQQTMLRELQSALAEVRTLRGMIKICATCKRVLTDEGSWQQFESYVHGHTDVEFSHGICPECAAKWSADAG
jgi:PAS domain S-box-containing protein